MQYQHDKFSVNMGQTGENFNKINMHIEEKFCAKCEKKIDKEDYTVYFEGETKKYKHKKC